MIVYGVALAWAGKILCKRFEKLFGWVECMGKYVEGFLVKHFGRKVGNGFGSQMNEDRFGIRTGMHKVGEMVKGIYYAGEV